jgi:hypothetical protein
MKAKHYGIVAALLIVSAIGGGVFTAFLVLTQSGYAQQAATPVPRAYTPPGETFAQPSSLPSVPRPHGPMEATSGQLGTVTTRAIQFVDENGKVRCMLSLTPNSSRQSQPRLVLTDEHGKVLSVLSGQVEVYPATR